VTSWVGVNPTRLFLGSGRLSDQLRAELAAEDLLLLEEGLTGSITLRRYRAPGQRAWFAKQAILGAIVITSGRLVVWVGRSKNIDVPLTHPWFGAIQVTVDRPDRVRFAYDAGRFSASRSGVVTVRLRTAQAQHVVELLSALG
jgi:hypothetical protein